MAFQPWYYLAARYNLSFLEDADEAVKDNDELVKIAVQNWPCLQHASDRLRSDKSIVLLAVSNDSLAIQYASDELRDDYDIAMAAVKTQPNSDMDWVCCIEGWSYNPERLGGLSAVSQRLRDNFDVVLASVKMNGYSLKFASDRLRDNDEIVLEALKSSNYGALAVASERFRSDKDIAYAAVSAGAISAVKKSLLNRELVAVAVTKQPSCFGDLPSKWRDDDEILKIAISADGKYLEFANEIQKSNFDLVKLAIESNPISLKFASKKIKNKEQLLEIAVSRGLLLPEQKFSNETLVLTNFANMRLDNERSSVDPQKLFYDDWYAGDWLKKIIKQHPASRDIANAALECKSPRPKTEYFPLFSEELRNDISFCCAAIRSSSYIYKMLSEELRSNRDIALTFIEGDSTPDLEDFPPSLLSDIEVVKKCLVKWRYNVRKLPVQFSHLPEAFSAKVLSSFDGSDLTDQEVERLCSDRELLAELSRTGPRVLLLRKGLQGVRDLLIAAAKRADNDYGSRILDELAKDREILKELRFIPENIAPEILADRSFIEDRVKSRHGFRGLDSKYQSDDDLVTLYLKADPKEVSERFQRLEAHIKKRENIVLLAISLGAIHSRFDIPEKYENNDRVLNAYYEWFDKSPDVDYLK